MATTIMARHALSPSPRAQGAPFGLRGLTAQRGQAVEAVVPKKAKKRPFAELRGVGDLGARHEKRV
jgi:hypothetical protein